MIKYLTVALAFLFMPTVGNSQDNNSGVPQHCEVIQGEPDVKICTFEPANSPACHKLSDYPGGPDQLAMFYGGQVFSYQYDPSIGNFILVIARPIGDGKMGSIALAHPGEPGQGPQEGAEACIVAIGTPLDPAM